MLALVVGAAALKIAITGSNSGIGLAASRQLLADGHSIIHACRSAEAAAVAASAAGGGTPMVCNLADLASVRKFAAELPSDVDVLCLNAGVSPSRKEEAPTRTVDGFQETWGVNHLAHFLLASLAQPQLAANKARLVITASGVHDPESPGGLVQNDPATGATLGDLSGLAAGAAMADGGAYTGAKAYHDSKLMNVLFCNEASKRWSGLDVAAFNPGLVTSTGLFRERRRTTSSARASSASPPRRLRASRCPSRWRASASRTGNLGRRQVGRVSLGAVGDEQGGEQGRRLRRREHLERGARRRARRAAVGALGGAGWGLTKPY